MAVFGKGATGRPRRQDDRRQWLALLTLLAGLSVSLEASAFCRSRTCNEDDAAHGADCQRDENDCITSGAPLYWPGPSFSFWVDARGSAKRNINGAEALETFRAALGAWTQSDCNPGSPSIAIAELTLVSDETALQQGLGIPNEDPIPVADKNTSVLSFVDSGWEPRDAAAIALTTMTYGTKSGRIFSSDMELNSGGFKLTTSDEGGDFDLQSVVTHECGHVFGLAHVNEDGPVMNPFYGGNGDIRRRSLQADDEAGICEIYPPDRFAAHGGCGCRTVPTAETTSPYWLLPLAICSWIARRKKRVRHA